MPLLGHAALAMWWDIVPTHRAEFEDWHSHEHFPERLGIPGFLRGSRWVSAAGEASFFVMYELTAYETLTSPHYLTRLNNPTPWSVKMMPHHRNMVRSQCRIQESFGGGVAGAMMTLRLSPKQGQGDALRDHLRTKLRPAPARPGLTGGHLLQTDTPKAATTEEQRIRGGDAEADWIVLVSGYDPQSIAQFASDDLAAGSLTENGALPQQSSSLYRLSDTMTPRDLP